MANIDSKPLEFYSKRVKNLWISTHDNPHAFEGILSVCSGVENLVLFTFYPFTPFLEPPIASSHLRRLTCRLEHLFPPWSTTPNFQHSCFANLTHLHLFDNVGTWSTYGGFENLSSLSHLALGYYYPEELAILMPKLPALEYVAISKYEMSGHTPRIDTKDPIEVYDIRVVQIKGLCSDDWEHGVTGRGDFWDLVEQEVIRRQLEAGMVRVLCY